jgi:anti-sigma regulatory factor (Ser/Thr protein kinase)
MTISAEQRFACDPTLPTRARRWLRSTLPAALPPAAAGRGLLGDAELVLSELVTNALRARCTVSTVRWQIDRSVVTVSVFDDADGFPRPVTVRAEDDHGRGLLIVGAVASRWGVTPEDCGKRTWAELTVCPR